MADQRPFSRFRLPWLSAVTAPQPQFQPQTTRPIEIVAPPQPQRPPFRPAGIAQPTQPPARTDPQPPSAPPRGVTESQVSSQPASPSRATTRTRAFSVPPSPSRDTTQAKPATSEAPARSPSRTAPQPRTASVPPSPTRTTTQPQPTPQTMPQILSSSRVTSQPSDQISSLPSSPPKRVTPLQPIVSQSSQFPPPPSQQEPKPAVSLQEAVEKLKAKEKKTGPVKDLPMQAREDKKPITAGSSGEQITTVSSTHPKLRKRLTESHQKPGESIGEQVSLQKEIKDDITKFVHKLATGQLKHSMDDKPVSIVTIAGENRGASMHVSSEPVQKEGSVHIHRGYKLNPDDSAGTTTDAEESKKGKKPKDPTREEQEKKAFLNSNTQSINNSMVLESSVNEGSPGIHLFLSQNLAEPTKSESLETHKAEFSVTPAQKLTYDPTIRRRCLRGLFLESSDSDPDNPEKPRRHGCRYYCGEKSKDKEIGVL